MNEQQIYENGWRPLPKLLKALFVFTIFGVISILYSLKGIYDYRVSSLLFLYVIGTGIFSLVGNMVILRGLWRRSSWTWKFGILFYGYTVVNAVLWFFLLLPKQMDMIRMIRLQSTFIDTSDSEPSLYFIKVISLVIVSLGVTLTIIVASILYKNRSYFIKP